VQPSPDAATYNFSLLRIRSREGPERLVHSLYKAARWRYLADYLGYPSNRDEIGSDIRLALPDIAVRCVEDVLIVLWNLILKSGFLTPNNDDDEKRIQEGLGKKRN